ncbi:MULTISPECIES: TolC family outer membrane protein [Deefgea]|uniref:TolC family outer membrane protein n=1 Tax=Deefgea chitinilytica TaxID=570276 RepID=A0ABS2CF18_9NEIS|nr:MULTISPECIES: TolC family outer membrane protein [Deefgea]MBM5572745.1 TolC family outer membrane protein [Deefgea chitinilytica]MBM9889981.1 TolC family outer membrane protein [Deefgea sp. CFH1-16]
MNRSLMFVFMMTAFSSTLHAEPLPQVIEGLLQSSPDILIESANRKASNFGVEQAKAGYFPQINVSAGAGREYLKDLATRDAFNGSGKSYNRQDAEVQLVQMLFDGNGVSSEVARQRARQLGAAHRLASTSEDIALKTTEAYLDVLLAEEMLKLTKANLAAHESTAEQVKLRTAGGFGRKSDDEQINARVALAKANLGAAQSAFNEAKIAYIRFVGTEPQNLTLPEQPTAIPQTAAEVGDWAVANNRALQAAKADVLGAQAQLGVAQSQMYPRINLEAGASYSNALDGISVEETTRAYGMLRVHYSFKSGADKQRVAETTELSYAAQELARRVERQVRQNASLSWNAMTIASERVPELVKYAESSKLARDEYSKQFSLGQRSLLDLLDGENEYFTASRDLASGKMDELRARFRLMADANLLLKTLSVEPLAGSNLPE